MREQGVWTAAIIAAAVVSAPALAGECVPDWDRTIGTSGLAPLPGANGFSRYVGSFATFNDGTGDALYIGGPFDNLGGICGTSGIAKWDGTTYVPLDQGVGNPFGNFEVTDMVVFDDGSGPALFVAGTFTNASGVPNTAKIAKWDGSQWHSVATGMDVFNQYVRALQVWDDGTGPALYMAGSFTSINGVAAMNIVKYDGTTFTPLLGGVGVAGHRVTTLEVFNNKLIVGGQFSQFNNGAMGGVQTALRLAEWNGTTWEQVAEAGIDAGSLGTSWVNDVQVFNDGTGDKLYIGGRNLLSPNFNDPLDFTAALVWDGGDTSDSVTSVGVQLPFTVTTFGVYDDGSGPKLYAGRQTTVNDTTTNFLIRHTGTGWEDVGAGCNGSVFALHAHDGDLYVGGSFDLVGGQSAGGVAAWTGGPVTDPAGWDRAIGSVVVEPTLGIADGHVNAFQVRNLFGQDYVYIGGSFTNIGGVCGSSGIVYWNAQTGFGAMDQGVTNPSGNFEVLDLELFDDGSGEAVFVAGTFQTASGVPNTSGLAKWNGSSWEPVAEFGFFLDHARALTVWDDGTGPALYIAGNFQQIRKPGDPTFVTANSIVKYDGTTFTPLGLGAQAGGIVDAVQGFNGKLYIGGFFTGVDGGTLSVRKLAAWDGANWSRPDNFRLDNAGFIFDLEVFDDGNGPRLYVGGRSLDIFTDPTDPLSGTTRTSVAVLDGSGNIDALSFDGVLLPENEVRSLEVFNDGTGDALYAAGTFTTTASRIAKLTDTGWVTVGGGADNNANGLFAWGDAATGEQLFVGGSFTSVGGSAANGVAVWTGCPVPVCPCEMDGDSAQVNVFDLLAYLDLWFAQDAGADIDGTAGVDVFDLLAYLDCWFPASAGAPCP